MSKPLSPLRNRLRENRETLAEMERADTGKPMPMAYAEVDGSIAYFEFYGSLVYLPTGDVLDVAPDQHVFTKREPYGIVGVITPWNLPLNQAARAIAPALVAGNVIGQRGGRGNCKSSGRAQGCLHRIGRCWSGHWTYSS